MIALSKTESILGCFSINTNLKFEDFGLPKSFFPSQNERLVYEEMRKGNRDFTIIFDNLKLKSKDIAAFLAKITDGLPKSGTTPERVKILIAEVEKERLRKEILKLINKGSKTGIFSLIKNLDGSMSRTSLKKLSLP